MDEDRARYLDIEQMVKRELRDAERVYVIGNLQNGLESGNNKPFWKYVKSQKQEIVGISALKSNGNVITDSLSKAEILNSQFKSVFTPQSGNTFPQLPGTQFPTIKPLHISENGVFMLLDRIDVSKSSGPDKLPGRLLQSLAKEITPVVHFIFTQSLCTGELPTEWTQANVAPIFKKGSKLQAVHYRHVSLTCITCKLFEHIHCKHILAHLEDHTILTDLQHGFRSGRSCETQLVTTFQDLAQTHNKKGSQILICLMCWAPLSQRRQEARLILFYKIIKLLFEGVLVEAYKGTRRKHSMKFRQIGHTTSQYGQSFFPKTISAWNGLAFAEAPSLAVFRSNFIKI